MSCFSVLALTPHNTSFLSMDAYLALPYLTASGLNRSGRGRSKIGFKNLYIVTQIFFFYDIIIAKVHSVCWTLGIGLNTVYSTQVILTASKEVV